jgi:hypothetical protein
MKELRFLLKRSKIPVNSFDFKPKKLALKLQSEQEAELDAWNYYRLGSFSIQNLKIIPRNCITQLFLYSCSNVPSIGMTLDHFNKLRNDLKVIGLDLNQTEWNLIIMVRVRVNPRVLRNVI